MWQPRFHIQRASNTLNLGGIIAYPTESVYGLGCDPNNHDAIKQLLHLKSRSPSKGLILIASEIAQLEPWVDFNRVPDIEPLLTSWPGPETWLVPKRKDISPLISGQYNTLAVRVTAHPIVSALCNHYNSAIISTSANLTGRSASRDLFSVRKTFTNSVNYYLPGNILDAINPTRIRDSLTGKVIRA